VNVRYKIYSRNTTHKNEAEGVASNVVLLMIFEKMLPLLENDVAQFALCGKVTGLEQGW